MEFRRWSPGVASARVAASRVGFAALILALTTPLASLAADSPPAKETPGYLGIHMQRVEGGLAEALGLKADAGVLVGQVVEESPASKAGLEAGDIITKIDGKNVGTPDDLRTLIRDMNSGETVRLAVLRDGKTQELQVTLGEADEEVIERRIVRRFGEDDDGEALPELREGDERDVRIFRGPGGPAGEGFHRLEDGAEGGKRGYLGVASQPLSEELGEYFGVEGGKGALVSNVVEGSPAEKLGLKAGDVITKVDGTSIEGPGDLTRVVRKLDEAKDVSVEWLRERKMQRGTTKLEIKEGGEGLGPDMRRHMRTLRDLPRRFEKRGKSMGPQSEWRREMRADLPSEIESLREELEELREELREMRESRR